MESIHDSRRPDEAAMEKTAVSGGRSTNGPVRGGAAQSGTPRSWRQYIEQTLPAQDASAKAEQEDAAARRTRPDKRMRTRSAWERFTRRFARWMRTNGKKARTAAVACRKKLGAAAVVCRKKFGAAAAVCRKKLGAAAIVCQKKLGPVIAACREKAGPVLAACGKRLRAAAAVCQKKFGPAFAACGKKLSAAIAVCRKKLSPVVAACREKLEPGAKKLCQGAKKAHAAVARHPVSPLLYVTLLAVFLGVAAFQGNYARAYVLEVNGQKVGLVSSEDEVSAILSNVESRAASVMGGDFDYNVEVTLSPVYAAPRDLTDAAEVENALFEEVGAYATMTASPTPLEAEVHEEAVPMAWAISVDGVELGRIADKNEFYRMLDEIAQPYLPDNAVRYEFLEDVQVYPVEMPLDGKFDDLEAIREELTALRVEEAVYVVKAGDTFNAIAYSLGMEPNDLSVLNPDVMVNVLWVDQELIIQQAVPRLSVVAFADVTYEEVVPCPVEYIETADLYVGNTQVKEQGETGLALVNAQVTYLNNVEQGREVLESTTLKEPTTTYIYTGTTPRPLTASNGYFIWPVWGGTVSSGFGSRNLWGSYDYHLGIDICVPYGSSVMASDGGTVTYAGWYGSYGYLVTILHDNGMVTAYAHNSSILVYPGQKVYQGQVIALVGMTGNASGPHCHFEVRVNGTCVNPRNYI